MISKIRIAGYKGLFFNITLCFLAYLLENLLFMFNRSANDYDMPWFVICFFTALLPFENNANKWILASEINKMRESHIVVWNKFSQTCFFGILLLMIVVWRTYFKMVFLCLPLFSVLYDILGFDYDSIHFLGKLPIYIVGLMILFGELILIRYTLEPYTETISIQRLWWSRIVIILLMTFFTISLQMMLRSILNLHSDFYEIGPNIFLLVIVFVFFYIPLRWVELVTDAIDCESNMQLWLFWLSAFAGMVWVIFM